MKVLDWSLIQEMIHQKEVQARTRMTEKPYGHDWTIHSYYCKKGGHLVPKEDALAAKNTGHPLCPLHHQLCRFHKHRTKYNVDDRKRVL